MASAAKIATATTKAADLASVLLQIVVFPAMHHLGTFASHSACIPPAVRPGRTRRAEHTGGKFTETERCRRRVSPREPPSTAHRALHWCCRCIETSGAEVQHASPLCRKVFTFMPPTPTSRSVHRADRNHAGCWTRAFLALLSLLAGPAIAGAQETISPDTESREAVADPTSSAIETVEVLGNRETVRKAAQAFVADLTRDDGDELARWRLPICAFVFGVSSELNEFVRQRILAIAATAGAPRTVQTDCRPNLFVVLTDQPEGMLTTLRERRLTLIGTGLPKKIDGVEPTIPVRIWRSTVLNNADGTGPSIAVDKVPEFRAENSRIVTGVAENIAAVVVMVDTSQTGTSTFGQLADFVAMVSLARIDLNADLSNTTTILRLFAPSAEALPPGLTDWDRAFLKGLYKSRNALVHQRSQIAGSMARDLVP